MSLRFNNPLEGGLIGIMTTKAELHDSETDEYTEIEMISVGILVIQLDIIW